MKTSFESAINARICDLPDVADQLIHTLTEKRRMALLTEDRTQLGAALFRYELGDEHFRLMAIHHTYMFEDVCVALSDVYHQQRIALESGSNVKVNVAGSIVATIVLQEWKRNVLKLGSSYSEEDALCDAKDLCQLHFGKQSKQLIKLVLEHMTLFYKLRTLNGQMFLPTEERIVLRTRLVNGKEITLR